MHSIIVSNLHHILKTYSPIGYQKGMMFRLDMKLQGAMVKRSSHFVVDYSGRFQVHKWQLLVDSPSEPPYTSNNGYPLLVYRLWGSNSLSFTSHGNLFRPTRKPSTDSHFSLPYDVILQINSRDLRFGETTGERRRRHQFEIWPLFPKRRN